MVVLERGEPVERRGRAIGAMAARGVLLNPDSNFCYGEGGAGTWSDGKLTTQIGRNSRSVREVLETLVALGAPEVLALRLCPAWSCLDPEPLCLDPEPLALPPCIT